MDDRRAALVQARPRCRLLAVPQLSLVPNAQHTHQVALRIEAVQSEKTALAVRDHQLSDFTAYHPADHRMIMQDVRGLEHFLDLECSDVSRFRPVERSYALEIFQRSDSERYLRQVLGFGRLTAWPCARFAI